MWNCSPTNMPCNLSTDSESLCYAYQSLSRPIRKLLDELRDVSVSHVKYTLFLELIDFHLKIDAVPPGLQVDIQPLGFNCDDNPSIWNEWKDELKNCSKSLMGILRYHYVNEISNYSWLKSSLKRQSISSIMLEKDCSREVAVSFVEDWIECSVHHSINNLTDMFYTSHQKKHSKKTYSYQPSSAFEEEPEIDSLSTERYSTRPFDLPSKTYAKPFGTDLALSRLKDASAAYNQVSSESEGTITKTECPRREKNRRILLEQKTLDLTHSDDKLSKWEKYYSNSRKTIPSRFQQRELHRSPPPREQRVSNRPEHTQRRGHSCGRPTYPRYSPIARDPDWSFRAPKVDTASQVYSEDYSFVELMPEHIHATPTRPSHFSPIRRSIYSQEIASNRDNYSIAADDIYSVNVIPETSAPYDMQDYSRAAAAASRCPQYYKEDSFSPSFRTSYDESLNYTPPPCPRRSRFRLHQQRTIHEAPNLKSTDEDGYKWGSIYDNYDQYAAYNEQAGSDPRRIISPPYTRQESAPNSTMLYNQPDVINYAKRISEDYNALPQSTPFADNRDRYSGYKENSLFSPQNTPRRCFATERIDSFSANQPDPNENSLFSSQNTPRRCFATERIDSFSANQPDPNENSLFSPQNTPRRSFATERIDSFSANQPDPNENSLFSPQNTPRRSFATERVDSFSANQPDPNENSLFSPQNTPRRSFATERIDSFSANQPDPNDIVEPVNKLTTSSETEFLTQDQNSTIDSERRKSSNGLQKYSSNPSLINLIEETGLKELLHDSVDSAVRQSEHNFINPNLVEENIIQDKRQSLETKPTGGFDPIESSAPTKLQHKEYDGNTPTHSSSDYARDLEEEPLSESNDPYSFPEQENVDSFTRRQSYVPISKQTDEEKNGYSSPSSEENVTKRKHVTVIGNASRGAESDFYQMNELKQDLQENSARSNSIPDSVGPFSKINSKQTRKSDESKTNLSKTPLHASNESYRHSLLRGKLDSSKDNFSSDSLSRVNLQTTSETTLGKHPTNFGLGTKNKVDSLISSRLISIDSSSQEHLDLSSNRRSDSFSNQRSVADEITSRRDSQNNSVTSFSRVKPLSTRGSVADQAEINTPKTSLYEHESRSRSVENPILASSRKSFDQSRKSSMSKRDEELNRRSDSFSNQRSVADELTSRRESQNNSVTSFSRIKPLSTKGSVVDQAEINTPKPSLFEHESKLNSVENPILASSRKSFDQSRKSSMSKRDEELNRRSDSFSNQRSVADEITSRRDSKNNSVTSFSRIKPLSTKGSVADQAEINTPKTSLFEHESKLNSVENPILASSRKSSGQSRKSSMSKRDEELNRRSDSFSNQRSVADEITSRRDSKNNSVTSFSRIKPLSTKGSVADQAEINTPKPSLFEHESKLNSVENPILASSRKSSGQSRKSSMSKRDEELNRRSDSFSNQRSVADEITSRRESKNNSVTSFSRIKPLSTKGSVADQAEINTPKTSLFEHESKLNSVENPILAPSKKSSGQSRKSSMSKRDEESVQRNDSNIPSSQSLEIEDLDLFDMDIISKDVSHGSMSGSPIKTKESGQEENVNLSKNNRVESDKTLKQISFLDTDSVYLVENNGKPIQQPGKPLSSLEDLTKTLSSTQDEEQQLIDSASLRNNLDTADISRKGQLSRSKSQPHPKIILPEPTKRGYASDGGFLTSDPEAQEISQFVQNLKKPPAVDADKIGATTVSHDPLLLKTKQHSLKSTAIGMDIGNVADLVKEMPERRRGNFHESKSLSFPSDISDKPKSKHISFEDFYHAKDKSKFSPLSYERKSQRILSSPSMALGKNKKPLNEGRSKGSLVNSNNSMKSKNISSAEAIQLSDIPNSLSNINKRTSEYNQSRRSSNKMGERQSSRASDFNTRKSKELADAMYQADYTSSTKSFNKRPFVSNQFQKSLSRMSGRISRDSVHSMSGKPASAESIQLSQKTDSLGSLNKSTSESNSLQRSSKTDSLGSLNKSTTSESNSLQRSSKTDSLGSLNKSTSESNSLQRSSKTDSLGSLNKSTSESNSLQRSSNEMIASDNDNAPKTYEVDNDFNGTEMDSESDEAKNGQPFADDEDPLKMASLSDDESIATEIDEETETKEEIRESLLDL